ncbi:MAG: dTDP-4-dehydrorhamnose reductase [Candidatus Doudnabacteria bacterium]|nr:dTDP-4-dehydrorhamnose reductase [Candidatus Doudnabacteria bacterium]
MKVLIIGANGMLGRALGESFADLHPALWDLGDIDITDFETSAKKIHKEKPKLIINAAAMTDVDGCEDNPASAHRLNGEAPGQLALLADELGAILVQYSTAYVFDGKSKAGYDESAMPMPLSVYGKTKLQGERGASMAKKHYILRLDRLFGQAGSGKQSFVEKMLSLAATNKPVAAIDDEYGCPTWSSDLALLTRKIFEGDRPFGIYHVANAGYCSWFEFAREIFKLKGIEVELVPVPAATFPRKAVRPKYAIINNTKLPLVRPWQEALVDYLANYPI